MPLLFARRSVVSPTFPCRRHARLQRFVLAIGLAAIFASASAKPAAAQTDLQVTFGANGLQTLAYKGVVLENLGAVPSDGFHIWHMKSTDMSGNVISTGQYGWGESNNGRAWNGYSNTWTYNFVWGSISVQYVQNGNNLDMVVTTSNNAGSGIIFDGATIYPLALNLPQLPVGFANAGYNQLADNTSGPGVTVADYGSGEVAAVVSDATKPLYSGFQPTGNGIGYTALISSTSPNSLASYVPHNDRPVNPGQTDTYTVSLRFAPSGTAAGTLATDAYKSWAATYPQALNWNDRRAIGTVYLASSPSGNVNQPGGYPNNPRRYFNDSNAADFDVTTRNGLAAFQARVLAQAKSNVANLKQLNAQGAITWDIEGEQYPQTTSYVCSPDQIAAAAPEMETVVTDASSPYAGMKLDDAYFKTMTDAGFRVGVCIRPQQFGINADGTAQQSYLPASTIAAQLTAKMKYAHDRWGATLFYIDSTVDSIGGVLPASIFQQAAAALPDSLLIPEESTPLHYAYTGPFKSFIDLGDLGTNVNVYNFYPNAFSVNLVNDTDASHLAAAQAQLTQQVRQGDILMAHVDYWQANNPRIVQIYRDAGVWTNPTAPQPTPATSTTALAVSSNSVMVGTSVTLSATVSPASAAGTVTFYDGTVALGSGTVSSGSASLSTSSLAAGPHTLTAVYGGSKSFAASTSAGVAMTVSALISTTTTLSASATSVNAGVSVGFTATVRPSATGTVTIYDNGKSLGSVTLNSGTATYTTSALSVGAHTITAVYGGSSTSTGSTSNAQTVTVTSPAMATSVKLSASVMSAQSGANIAFTAAISPAAATGNVTFYDNGAALGTTTLVSGTATFATASLSGGSHSVKAVYSGSSSYAPGTSPNVTVTVTAKLLPTSTTLTTTSMSPTAGASVMFSASVQPAAAGTVTFYDGTAVLGVGTLNSGNATFATTALAVGRHSFTATFGGSTTYASSTSAAIAVSVAAPAAPPASPVAILSPTASTWVSSRIVVLGQVNLPLDAAGSFLMVDGAEIGTRRMTGPPYQYPLDTTTLPNGPHTLQIWAHDIGNNTTISAGVVVIVAN